MQHNLPSLSIIVPVYNEQKRLHHLPEICEYFQGHEIIFVNDGSTDSTLAKLKSFQQKYPIKILSYPYNRGKGFAVRYGMLSATGKHRLFMDLDLSVSPQFWLTAKKYLSNSPVIIAVRRLPESNIAVHQPFIRENMGRIFTWLSQTILETPISDFTCGFKVFSAESALQIFSRSRIDRWGFDSEILFLAHGLGYKITQLPVVWVNDTNTRVHLVRDAFTSFLDLLFIKIYSLLGVYTRTLT